MRNRLWSLCILTCVIGLIAGAISGAPFDPEFKVVKITGECTVKAPGAGDFAAAEEGKSYPYGSDLKTGRNSSAIIQFSEGNQCRVLANASLTVTEGGKNKKLKRLVLQEGTVKVELEKKVGKAETFQVETATAICGAVGTKFSVGVRNDIDVNMLVVVVENGKVRLIGKPVPVKGFDIKVLDEGDAISIATSKEKQWIRIKNVKGKFVAVVPGPDGRPKNVELDKGQVIKIVIAKGTDEDKFILTIMIVGADGKEVLAAWTVGEKTEKPGPRPGTELELLVFPTTTTTTTTIPSPTPVGDR